MWIVEAKQDPFRALYLYDYAAGTKEEVGRKVMDVAFKQGFRGSAQARLQSLQWDIVEVHLVKAEQAA